MKLQSLEDLLMDILKDTYNAENQLLKALPKMAKTAETPALREAFETHLEQTRGQVDRLEQVFKLLDAPARGKKCKAMEGLLEEGKEIMEMEGNPGVIDAGLICAAQKVEHYEIASYGCAVTYAQLLGLDKVARLLQESLAEEEETDKLLTDIAESEVNFEAAAEDETESDVGRSTTKRRGTALARR